MRAVLSLASVMSRLPAHPPLTYRHTQQLEAALHNCISTQCHTDGKPLTMPTVSFVLWCPPQLFPEGWDQMDLGQKVYQLYMGKRGILFWATQAAWYGSIALIVSWAIFRWVAEVVGHRMQSLLQMWFGSLSNWGQRKLRHQWQQHDVCICNMHARSGLARRTTCVCARVCSMQVRT